MLNFLKHRNGEYDSHSSSGFTLAELGAGLGVFAVAASLMAPMAVSSATATLTADSETNVTVNNDNNDGRKTVFTPPVDAIEITVKDAAGNEVKTVTVDDPDATETVVSGLDPDGTYTFEVAKVNAAGKSAKATAILDYKKTGTENYQVEVTENYTETKEATVSAVPEQVDDTTRPQYVKVDDTSNPIYKQVRENYTVMVDKTRTVRQSYSVRIPYQVNYTAYRTESYRVPYYRNWTHTHWTTTWTTRTRTSNHTHRTSWNHPHRTSWNHFHRSPYGGGWNHRHSRTFNHTHSRSFNHVHRSTYRVSSRSASYHPHRDVAGYNNRTRRIPYTATRTEYRNETRYRNVTETYKAPETRTRMKTVFDRYAKKNKFVGYAKKTQYRLCYQPRGRNGVKQAMQCEIKNSPATKRLSWVVDKQRQVTESRTRDVWNHVKQTMVQAQPGYVVFEAEGLTNGRIFREGTVAAVGTGVNNFSKGSTARFLRWSGKPFQFNGKTYIKVHRFAIR